jgi:poly(hydroxyalkanoate) depolymerase family esterase
MSSTGERRLAGGRRFADRATQLAGAARQHASSEGMGLWTRRVTDRRRPPTSASPEPGSWDEHGDDSVPGGHRYAVYTPAGLSQATTPAPLIVVLHGCRQSAKDAALGTGVNALADRMGCVVVYPEQSTTHNSHRCWKWYDRRHQIRGSGEPAAIAGITRAVLEGYDGVRLDRNRVHIMGLSAGGAMAGILAATYPDLYASAGIHSAPQFGAAHSVVTAALAMKSGGPDPERQGRLAHAAMGQQTRVVPVIVVQGEADRTVWAGNGDRVVRQWLATSRLASEDPQKVTDGADQGFEFSRPHASYTARASGGLSYSVRSWNDDANRPVVQYWSVTGLGHAWSGGAQAGSYTDPRGPDVTAAMGDFFARCSLDRDVPTVRQPRPNARPGARLVALGRTVKRLGRRS